MLDVIGGPHCVWLYRSEGLSYKLAPFTGRSDYGPFIAEGTDIPGMHPQSLLVFRSEAGLM